MCNGLWGVRREQNDKIPFNLAVEGGTRTSHSIERERGERERSCGCIGNGFVLIRRIGAYEKYHNYISFSTKGTPCGAASCTYLLKSSTPHRKYNTKIDSVTLWYK